MNLEKTPLRIWVLARNDGEAVEIERLLKQADEHALISRQIWGASWRGLEEEIRRELVRFQEEHPEGVIYGIELAGPEQLGAVNIDHHRYRDEDRSHPLSSLEQVAEIMGVELDGRQQLVAANDRGYIPAMLELGATDAEVDDVRRQDRQAQGITSEDEEQAEKDLAAAKWLGAKVDVWCPQRATSAHSDRLYGVAEEALLRSPDQWEYYGPKHRRLAECGFSEHHWSGGRPESGFFGIKSPSAETREQIWLLFQEPMGKAAD